MTWLQRLHWVVPNWDPFFEALIMWGGVGGFIWILYTVPGYLYKPIDPPPGNGKIAWDGIIAVGMWMGSLYFMGGCGILLAGEDRFLSHDGYLYALGVAIVLWWAFVKGASDLVDQRALERFLQKKPAE